MLIRKRSVTPYLVTVLSVAWLFLANSANASDIDVVKAFYAELLTTPADADGDKVRAIVAEDWVSIPTPRGGPGAEGLIKSLAGFAKAVPDLQWQAEEILQDGNRYIVRGKATGTPAGPFFGIDPATGKSFEIMSIDIHTVENGKIVRSYHVEEWTTAIRQLTAN